MPETRFRNPDLRKFGDVCKAADDGLFAAPDELAALRQARQRIADGALVGAESPSDLTAGLHDDLMSAAIADRPLPTSADVASRWAAAQASAVMVQAASDAMASFEHRLLSWFAHNSDALVAGHIRPAVELAIDEARKAAAALEGHDDLSPKALLGAPAKVREARQAIDAIVGRYGALRNVQGVVQRAQQPRFDIDGEFAEMRNRRSFLPNPASAETPWPGDDAALRLLWLVSNGAELWCPTVDERDAAYLERYPVVGRPGPTGEPDLIGESRPDLQPRGNGMAVT